MISNQSAEYKLEYMCETQDGIKQLQLVTLEKMVVIMKSSTFNISLSPITRLFLFYPDIFILNVEFL